MLIEPLKYLCTRHWRFFLLVESHHSTPLPVHQFIHRSLFHALRFYLFQRTPTLVVGLCRIESADRNRIESYPAIAVCSRRRITSAALARCSTSSAIGFYQITCLLGQFLFHHMEQVIEFTLLVSFEMKPLVVPARSHAAPPKIVCLGHFDAHGRSLA
jgi:hypothetical protein